MIHIDIISKLAKDYITEALTALLFLVSHENYPQDGPNNATI